MIEAIDGIAFKKMIIAAAASVEAAKQQINELNVFPVPDGDTGTNMSLTIGTAAAELRKQDFQSIGKAAEITAKALLRGARGNSGVILSILFRGISKVLKDIDESDGLRLAAALTEGVDSAYKAVMKPAEGTILTVSRVSSARAMEAAKENNLIDFVLEETIKSARKALAATVDQNPVLKKAGVIDAGGKGYLIILEAMLRSVRGEDHDVAFEPALKEKADFTEFDAGEITFGYCTEFIISRENQKDASNLMGFLSNIGDSLVLVDDDEVIKVHVHTDNPGTAIQEALTYGSLTTVKIENMRLQHSEIIAEAESVKITAPEKKYGFVAVCAGAGMASVFTDLGADGIIEGGQTMNPSTDDILKRINSTPAEIVFVLPNNSNIIMAAQQCVPLTEKKVIVIPTKTVPQGIAAMLAMDFDAEVDENSELMTQAISKVKTLQITYAARDSDYDGHVICQGDYLALYENQLLSTGPELEALLIEITERLHDAEFINIFYGEGVSEADAESTRLFFEEHCPKAEVNLLLGGQPVYYYMISAE